MPQAIRSVEEFYAHAIAIEREAAERYREFAAYFGDRSEPVLEGLCETLAGHEQAHFEQLVQASLGLALPALAAGEHRWLEAGPPEAPAREVFYRIAQPHHLLEIALQSECNALAFFDRVAATSANPAVCELARSMAAEEKQHVRWVRDALEYQPHTHVDWERLLETD